MKTTGQLQSAVNETRFLGVLGGLGPMAGASFLERLTALTRAPRDQDHIPTILWSDPRVPDRTDAKLHGGANPLPLLLNGIEHLEKAGASAIAIPCNSAHLWYDELLQHTDLPILNIIDATVDDLHNHGVWRGKIGLMGTAATLKFGMYQKVLEARGFTPVVPTEEEIDEYCMKAIRLVKANRLDEAFAPAAEGARLLKERGATAIVLGCTELPLAIPHHRRPELPMSFVDSIDGLAVAAIHWFYGTGLPVMSEAA
ncbi:aspartate/glutamate racemase family protein [Paraburkholderia unamae]|uniref:Aspartate racemase n=1 Tax=Paraburkholderia unamae TaxID=219649 RepID=A0ABX5KBJ5_9BURK|nr:amino acid racemase [Paraburkholderia unamae]PVX72826.1 aspartate racemase [Paraburkholderia unamae]RAR54218.1 aspartate racemase [Paraburkholderia unamae]CAG9272558.1 Aspartate racemase [Paraburkholderia unamae]